LANKKKTTKSFSLDAATSELIAKLIEDEPIELIKKNIFTASDLLRAAVLDYLQDYFEAPPEVLREYISKLHRKHRD